MPAQAAYTCHWTRYRLVSATGEPRRLLKVTGPAGGVKQFRLLTANGQALDHQPVPPTAAEPWHFGFWVPETHLAEPHFVLDRVAPVGCPPCPRCELRPGPADPEADALPLRLDRLGDRLAQHLHQRESLPDAVALADFVPDPAAYLHQHRVIYQRPAAHWSEGLPLGNGTVGVTVTGVRGQSQTFFLDRCDLWAASPRGRPYGRIYAGQLDLAYARLTRRPLRTPQLYLQELSLHEAEVVTRDGALTTTARVSAVRDRLELTVDWRGRGRLRLGLRLSKQALPLLDDGDRTMLEVANGSWEAVRPPAYIDSARRTVAAAPHTAPRVHLADQAAVLDHGLPNLRYAMAARVQPLPVTWQDASTPRLAVAAAEVTLRPGDRLTITVAVTSDRASQDPVSDALALLPADAGKPARDTQPADGAGQETDEHRAWWARYWRRSFIELPDKLVENLWYFGAYHQAAFSRSPVAPGFLGLWHPLDHRTWQECHVADAQTALLYWAPFAINHLELLLSSHHSFAELLPAFLRHHAGAGALVPHMFAPEWAGGGATFGTRNPYKGSIAWLGLNFWADYLHTRDHEFLAEVAYPVVAACADYHLGDLVRGTDGRRHCLGSCAAEQDHTEADNCYDRALIGAILRAAAEAAAALGVEPEREAAWRGALGELFEFPADATTLLETARNPHPYRCHPVVLFGIHPSGCIEPGDPLWAKAQATYEVVTNLFGFHYEDRHATIPGHVGGQEPNGHATSFLMHAAARLRGWSEVRRLVYGLAIRTQLKRNGLRSIVDPRHDRWLTNMAISEATSGQTSGLSEALLQNYSDHARVLTGVTGPGIFRFAGLRAYGGFVLAGESVDGTLTRLSVHSLRGSELRLVTPWAGQRPQVKPATEIRFTCLADGSEALVLATAPGVTYRLTLGPPASPPPPRVEPRVGPRVVACGDWDDFSPPIVYYPEDPPFAQDGAAGRVYLGMPESDPTDRLPVPDWGRILLLVQRQDWQARQTAARWLARHASKAATDLLLKLGREDTCPVVRYTAGVSLVRQGTTAGLSAALSLARDASLPHLRREILKAVGRLSHTSAGTTLLAATFGDLGVTSALFGAGATATGNP